VAAIVIFVVAAFFRHRRSSRLGRRAEDPAR
jgi:hypothetical protein